MMLCFRQFQAGMLFRDSALLDRIFRVFDVDDDNQISFYEYLSCLSTISTKAGKEDKLRCKIPFRFSGLLILLSFITRFFSHLE